MEFKGTKGKWHVSKAYQTITDEKGFGIAQEHGIRNSEEWGANALLISKAPELLEMLKGIYQMGNGAILSEQHIEAIEQLIKESTDLQIND